MGAEMGTLQDLAERIDRLVLRHEELKRANALLEQGVRASVYEWPRGTPLKADIGYLLTGDAL